MIPSAKTVCLTLGGITIALLALVLVVAWNISTLQTQRTPKVAGPHSFRETLESAQSCEALKPRCLVLAQAYEVQAEHIAFLNRSTDRLVEGLSRGSIVWAIVTAAGFFYAAWALNRLEKKAGGKVAP